MRAKILVMLVLLLVALVAGYFIGFSRAHGAYLRQQAIFDLHVYPQLYMRLQEGNTNLLAAHLRSLIIGPYNYYEGHFGDETVTDEFTNDLAVARVVYNEERAAAEESSRTNGEPDTALEPVTTVTDASRTADQLIQKKGLKWGAPVQVRWQKEYNRFLVIYATPEKERLMVGDRGVFVETNGLAWLMPQL